MFCRTSDQRKRLKREASLTRNIKKLFLEAIAKLPPLLGGDEAIFNTCIYTLLLDAFLNLSTHYYFVEELVPIRQNFPAADVMNAMWKVVCARVRGVCAARRLQGLQVCKVDENGPQHHVFMRALDHVGQRLESVRGNCSSYLASPELHHSLLFFLEVSRGAI